MTDVKVELGSEISKLKTKLHESDAKREKAEMELKEMLTMLCEHVKQSPSPQDGEGKSSIFNQLFKKNSDNEAGK